MPRSRKSGRWAVTANAYRSPSVGDKSVLELDSGDGCITS